MSEFGGAKIIYMRKILFFMIVTIAVHANAQSLYNGHEYVDLGLPSGLKWATMNVGANSTLDCGSLFAWGGVNKFLTK